MKQQTRIRFRIRFVLRRVTANKMGFCPINCRVTIGGIKANDFSTHLTVHPDKWDSKQQRIKGASDAVADQNKKLENIKYNLEDIFNQQRLKGVTLTAKQLTDIFCGRIDFEWPLSKLSSFYLEDLRLRNRSKTTISRYRRCFMYLQEFLGADRHLETVDPKDVSGFWRWLKSKDFHNDYCNKIAQACIGLFRFGEREGCVTKNPFIGMKLEWTKDVDVTYLTSEELDLIQKHQWSPKLQKVVDSFIFMAFTGLHIGDYIATNGASQTLIGGVEWLKIKRIKTKVPALIPLHSSAKSIIAKYGGIDNLPKISGQKSNDYLKLVAEAVGINKNLTNKIARKTFTNMALNQFNMSFESVASMLGHTTTKQVKYYGTVNEQRIYSEWKDQV